MDTTTMGNFITAIQSDPTATANAPSGNRLIPTTMHVEVAAIIDIGKTTEISSGEAMDMVYERSLAKLQSVVDEARAELGIPEGEVLDTSPEATANRIADFALGFFDKWLENHSELGEDAARQQFTEFIGSAIGQGIDEARGILTALNSLSPEIDNGIDTIAGLVQQRLDDFAANL